MEKIRQFGLKYGYHSAIYFSYTLLAAVSLILIGKIHMPLYLNDEFCYWGIAASIAGYDWHDLLAVSSYYSFGYSILLIPLFFLNRLGISMLMLYKLAILINGVFLILSFKMTNYVAEKMFPNLNRYYSLLICLVTTLYVNNVGQIYSTWTEMCLYFMFWCVLVCLVKVLENPRLKHLFLLLFATAYIFMVHMRAVGVVISVGIILAVIILLTHDKFPLKKVIIILASIGILFLLVFFAKELITHYIYANNLRVSINDFSGQSSKIIRSTSGITGLYSYLLSILGKLYYLGIASWGFAFLALAVILFKVIKMAIRWIRNKKIAMSFTEILFIFIGMAGMAQVCITAMYKLFSYDSSIRPADTICFGRYSDFIIGPLILIGLAMLPEISRYLKEIFLSLLMLFISAIIVQSLFERNLILNPEQPMIIRASQVVGMYYFFPDQIAADALLPAFISGILFMIIVFINLYEERNKNVVKRVRISAILLLLIGSMWCGFGLKYANGTTGKYLESMSVAELISDIGVETDIYMIDYNTFRNSEAECVQWLCPELVIRIITMDEFNTMNFDKETIYLTGDNPSTMAQVSDCKKLVYCSGRICIYTEPGSKAETKINEKLETAQSEGDFAEAEGLVDLEKMMTDLSYQKYNGSLYYNFNRAGYMTWNTDLQLPDGTYEFTIDMEVSGLADGSEIGYIMVTDTQERSQKTYPLNPQDFSAGSRQQIKVQAKVEDYAEPLVGIYNNGNCSMKVNNVDYQQIRGNTAIADEKAENLREIGKMITQLNDYRKMAVCYVDSDSSAITGFPDFKAVESAFPDGISETMPGVLVPDKKNIGNRYYLMENTGDNTVLFSLLDKGSIAIYKNKLFTLLVPDDSAMREIATEQGLKVLADGKAPMDIRFLYETKNAEARLSEMSDISLPRGRYEVSVNFKIEEIDSIDAALIFLNGEEIKITREMLDENYYREVYELELTESSSDVRLGLFASRQCRITEEYIGVKRIGDCYGYIQKIPVYDLECENAVCYADSIITEGVAESSIVLQNFPLEFGEYMLTFTGQQMTGTDAAQIKIYRNGVLRTDESLMFEGEGEQEFAFGLNEYEPAEWDFEIICLAGSRLELSDFAIVR